MRPSPWPGPGLPDAIRLRGRQLIGARSAWVVVATIVVALFGASLPVGFTHLRTVCTEDACSDPQLSVSGARAIEAIGLSVDVFAAYVTAVIVVFAGGYFALAGLIFWHKSDEPLALLASLMLVTFGAAFPPTLSWLGASDPAWWWLSSIVHSLGICMFFVFFYLFPDGRFVPAWTRALVPVMFAMQASDSLFPSSPLSYGTWPPFLVFLLFLGWFGTVLFAQVHRYRRVSSPVQRQQTKWVVFGVAAALVGFLAVVLGGAVLPPEILQDPVLLTAAITASYLFLLLVPLSMTVAIFRHRLWDIDVIINRTLVYGALTGIVAGLYILLVGGLGAMVQARGSLLLSLAATGLIAVLFAPLRDRLQRGVNRLLYGERDEPYGVLSRLGQRLEETLAPEAVLPSLVEGIARALRLPHVAIWLVDGKALRLGATHGRVPSERTVQDAGAVETLETVTEALRPVDLRSTSEYSVILTECGAALVLPLTHRGDFIGALSLAPRSPGETFSPADRRLLRDLASQAGAAVHAVQLTAALGSSLEELRRSRERLVAAQEEERRRIQRDLHDGLGPALASMRLRLEACLDMAEETPAPLHGHLVRLHELVGQASGDIRRLVYDLRPPVLDQLGLVPALRQHCERFGRETGIEVRFEADSGLTYPAAAEVATFRVVQEALVNIQKHARASEASVQLWRCGEWLELVVRDDGAGFDADGEAARSGTGMGSMRERAEVLGGAVCVTSNGSNGTEVLVRIPDRR